MQTIKSRGKSARQVAEGTRIGSWVVVLADCDICCESKGVSVAGAGWESGSGIRICRTCAADALEATTGYHIRKMIAAWDLNAEQGRAIRAARREERAEGGTRG